MTNPTVPSPPSGPRTFGRFVIERELGRGGMGIVYKALDPRLKRPVALKVLIGEEALVDSDRVKRFLREAHSVAKLRHPNVVQIYELGEVGKQHYFTMDFVEGGSLDSRIAHALDGTKQPARSQSVTTASPRAVELSEVETAGPYNLYDTLTLTRDLARGLGCAHAQHLVHRDVKPANVLIDRKGVPYLTDFGLAKEVGELAKSVLTLTGTVVGTPMYMSPEQAAGRVSDIGPPTDVWSLGVVLYELLTGRVPFEGESLGDIFHQIARKSPPPPSAVKGGLHSQVDGLVMKCLEKDPALRYADGDAFADDIDRFLAGEQMTAQAPRALQQARITEQRLKSSAIRRIAGRKRALRAAAIGLPLLVVIVLLWLYASQRSAATTAHDEAVSSAARMIEAKQWKKALSFIEEKLREYPSDTSLDARRNQVKEQLARIQEALSKADQAFENKDFIVAKASYQDALALDSLDERARSRFAEAEALLFKLDQSLARGDKLLNDGDAQGALSSYRAALDVSPTSAHAQTGVEEAKKKLAARTGSPDQAVPSPPPPSKEAVGLYEKALHRSKESMQDWLDALADIKMAIEVFPEYGDAWHERGVLHQKLGEDANALTDYAHAIEYGAFIAESHYARGKILFDQYSDRAQARVEFDAAVKADTIQEQAHIAKARIALIDRDMSLALSEARESLDAKTRMEESNYVAGCVYESQQFRDLEKALLCFNETIRLSPTDWSAWAHRSVVHYLRGEFDQGLADADRAVAQSNGRSRALERRALNLMGLGRYEEARTVYDQEQGKTGDREPSLFCNRGECEHRWARHLKDVGDSYSARDHLSKAIADWEHYLELAPAGPERDSVREALPAARKALEDGQ